MKAYFVDAVTIGSFDQLKKGATVYRVPKFSLKPVADETTRQAIALDAELQSFLSDYLKRPKAEAAPVTQGPEEVIDSGPARHFDDFKDDIPF